MLLLAFVGLRSSWSGAAGRVRHRSEWWRVRRPAAGMTAVQGRRRNPDETTARLLEAAAREFIERGYEATRVSDIARGAGVTTGAVYARWPHKADVIVAALEHIFAKILPERELDNLGVGDAGSLQKLALLGANLLTFDEHRDVTTQVFGSARNNEAIRQCLLDFLDSEVQQLGRIVSQMKDDGFIDPAHSTTAVAFICQALGIGSHLLITSGLAERHVPSEDEWSGVLLALISGMGPRN